MTKYVYAFAEGDRDLKDLLGGKGANLAEMTNLGLPVPPGFTITTEACRAYLGEQREPAALAEQVTHHLSLLEQQMGKRLGDPDDPLLVSVRSGAKFSMPGMMETVLNVGLNDASVLGLAIQSDDERFAWDSYRRLLAMFGKTVMDVPGEPFDAALERAREGAGATHDHEIPTAALQQLCQEYKSLIRERSGQDFPQEPRTQLDMAVRAVFNSWHAPRAVLYRRQERIPADLGTAVNVVAMVFGNLGMDSGTGVAFTRDPATGERGLYGDYLTNAQGEDVVAGIRNTVPLTELESIDKTSFDELVRIMGVLERHYRDLCDIEFTIERGRLWMLQTRVGKRTAAAAFTIAAQLVDEGLIDLDEALLRVTGAQLSQLMFPRFDGGYLRSGAAQRIATGVNASPGAAVGRAVFDTPRAVELAGRGEAVILVRRETSPDDLPAMIAAQGVLTSRGGKTSHAAVVARGMGKTCVSGAEELDVRVADRCLEAPGGVVVREGDLLSIDGSSGAVYLGEVPVTASPVVEYFEGAQAAADPEDHDPLVEAVRRIMAHADATRRLAVRANADTAEDAARARRFGAAGIGLCRTEHMFLGERRAYVERLIVAEDGPARECALAALLPLQRDDFIALFTAMDGLPVTVRLLDPPLHEFLPEITELSTALALAEERERNGGPAVPAQDRVLLEAVQRLHEQNPMLGLRGVRLGVVVPGLYATQVRAIAEAAAHCVRQGLDPRPEIMIPLVATVQELEIIKEEADGLVAQVSAETGVPLRFPVGTMIEVPRAAVTAGEIAEHAEFFSFGTNDLTQMTWGFSRDDVEGTFFPRYIDLGILGVSPFESIDPDGVGALVNLACERGRAVRPGLHLGVCGEHAGDPESVHFFHHSGLDYVSCSPFRIPIARLEAGRAVLSHQGTSDSR